MLPCHWKKETQRTCAVCCFILFCHFYLLIFNDKNILHSMVDWIYHHTSTNTWAKNVEVPQTSNWVSRQCISVHRIQHMHMLSDFNHTWKTWNTKDLLVWPQHKITRNLYPCVVNFNLQAKSKTSWTIAFTQSQRDTSFEFCLLFLYVPATQLMFIASVNPKEPNKNNRNDKHLKNTKLLWRFW